MRLTTKIVLGIIGGFTLLSLLNICYVKFKGYNDYRKNVIAINNENLVAIPIANFKTIIFELDKESIPEEDREYSPNINGQINVLPQTNDTEGDVLWVPEEIRPWIKTIYEDSILKVHLKLDNDFLLNNSLENFKVVLTDVDFKVQTNKAVNIGSNIDFMKIILKDLNAEELFATSQHADIEIINCHSKKITPHARGYSGTKIIFRDCSIDVVELNLDFEGYWLVENSQIETANIRGGNVDRYNYSEKRLSKDMFKKINWHPTEKGDKFKLELDSDSTEIIFK